MIQYNYGTNSRFGKNISTALLGASVLVTSITPTYASKESTSYDNSRNIAEKMSRRSGSSVNIIYNMRQSQLSTIKENLGLNNEELAEILGVSRKTLYNWEENGIRKDKDKKRVFELSLIAEDWRYNKLPTDKEKLNVPVLESKSVLTMLMDEKLNRQQVIFAGQRLAHQSLKPEVGLI